MRIDSLHLQNYRGFSSLYLDLGCERTTVLVGSNGCGKTSILDGLALLSKYLVNEIKKAAGIVSAVAPQVFQDLDIKNGSLSVECSVTYTIGPYEIGVRAQQQRRATVSGYVFADTNRQIQWLVNQTQYPVLVYYSVARAALDIPLRIHDSQHSSPVDAYEGALDGSDRNFRAFFEWYREREDLENESRQEAGFRPDPQLQAVRTAVEKFMPGYTRLRVRRSPLRMTVMKGAQEVQVTQLSDGEKCLLALVGDLARRLALANPEAESPCDGTGVVLIDEIELHLHPRWQRSVIPNLEKTFPNCQFIVTTHSPQVLADVGPGAVVVLEPDADGNVVAKRAKSPLGHDSNYILEVLMGVSERPQALADELERLFALIDDNDLAEAKKLRASIIEKWNADIPALTKAEVAIQRKERFAK